MSEKSKCGCPYMLCAICSYNVFFTRGDFTCVTIVNPILSVHLTGGHLAVVEDDICEIYA